GSAAEPARAKPRDKWFCRRTLADDERVRQYVKTLRRYDGMMPDPWLIVFDDGNPYGEGLKDAIVDELGAGGSTILGWSQLVAGGLASANDVDFTPGGTAKLDPPPGTVFVLGPNTAGVRIARGIESVLRSHGATPPRFFFVGAERELRTGAPEGSFTIGEPAISDPDAAARVKKEFKDARGIDGDGFIVTAYDAARYVLPRAIGEVVAKTT